MRAQVAVVVVCHDLGRYLEEALESVRRQTLPASEVVVVDDGSTDLRTRQVLARLEEQDVRVVRTPNRGLSAARNLGVGLTSAPYVVVLDADDLLAPTYLERHAEVLKREPDVGFVGAALQAFGAARYVWAPPTPTLPRALVFGYPHCSAMFRRASFEAVGGFDEAFSAYEDMDFWTGVLARGFRARLLPEPLFFYRIRERSMLRTALRTERHAALMEAIYRKHSALIVSHAVELLVAKEEQLEVAREYERALLSRRQELRQELSALEAAIAATADELARHGEPRVDLGERRTSPLSPDWGVDRGLPVDRHYIESFLERHQGDVQGRVLEVKDDGYTRRFGGTRVELGDVLDVDPTNRQATITGDLTRADGGPADAYDCFILTQTLQYVTDPGAAFGYVARALRSGGVLLCTVPAVSRIDGEDGGAGLDGDRWRFTEAGLRTLLVQHFAIDAFEITAFGNVLACNAFLLGLASHELSRDELDAHDPFFPLVYGVRAVKAAKRSPPLLRLTGREPKQAGIVLAYHRVARPGSAERPDLCVSPERFREHMDLIGKHLRPLPLSELVRLASMGELPDRAVAITFDDGYADALEAADVLVDRSLPATYFVTTGPLEGRCEHWWDTVARALDPTASRPSRLELDLPTVERGLATATREERAAARAKLHAALLPSTLEVRTEVVSRLIAWAELDPTAPSARPLDRDELQRLAALPGQTIGCHTRHHLFLPTQPAQVQRDELVSSRRALEAAIGRPVVELAYPYGASAPATVRAAREAGFEVAVTGAGGAVQAGCYPLLVPRVDAGAFDEHELAAHLTALAGR